MALALRFAVGTAIVAINATALTQTPTTTPTFDRDIAPLLSRRCVQCHQPDGDAPFSLVRYDEVRSHARQIAEVTARRYMPPWKPDADSPAFLGERRLKDDEIALIDRWVKTGMSEGLPHDPLPEPHVGGGWLSGEPDLILTLPTYTLRADGLDVFRNFVVTVPGHQTRYVRAFQFRPRSRGVHHANIRIDPTPASRALDEADPAPGYEGVILHSAEYPDGHFLGWTPGQTAPPSNDLAWRLDGGTDLVVQLHMRPTGRTEQIAPLIGLYFTSEPSPRTPAIVRLGRQNLDIAPGASDYRSTDSFVLPVDAQVMAIQPHAHYRAREVTAWAAQPDGSRRSLIGITDWDFNWQDQYRLAQPFWLPAGTTLAMTFRFDNSANNPRNPSHPPERVAWGWRSSDEMGDVWIQMLARNETDRQTLMKAARRKTTEEDAIGSEVLIAREPNHVNLRNDAALIYQELGQPERALTHFSAVARLEPRSPAAHYNEGITLEVLGREQEAAAQYDEAIRLDPSYAPARIASANLLYRHRQLDAAIAEYRAGLRVDGANVIARCSLARALTETNRPADAVTEYRSALAMRPDSLPCLINFAWLLTAHSDATIRRPSEAVPLAERAVELTNRQGAEALDVLAAAYASADRFDDAVRVSGEALRVLDRGSASPLVEDVRGRSELYKRHVAFIVPQPAPAGQQPTTSSATVPAATVAAPNNPNAAATAADHQNMMEQLGVNALRPGPSGNESASNHANYDESVANPYPRLPDALTARSGNTVSTAEMWWKQRRPEIIEDFDREVLGRVPRNVPRVAWRVSRTEKLEVAGRAVMRKDLIGTADNSAFPEIAVQIEMTLVTPAETDRPVPVMMMLTRTVNPLARDQLISDGWGYATIDPGTIQADNGAGLTKGIIGLANEGQRRRPDDWGALRAWAWGASRGLDYLETDKAVDAKNVGIEGVSRFGKAALVTMAYDQRFAVVLIGSSGEGGAKLHRRNFGEAVENLTAAGEYHWMAGNFLKYGAEESSFGRKTAADLPVDAHELIALCAPRPTFVSYGIPERGDAKWLDQQGSYMAAVAAQPVFRLLGAKDLGVSDDYMKERMPHVNVGLLDGQLAWRQHDGGHTDGPNWTYFIPWADNMLARTDASHNGPADRASPRTDQNSWIAHAQLVEKAKQGKIDVYFEGDSIVRRWGALDYPELLANWRANFFGWNVADFGWGADRTENILWRLEN
ncbi:MAG TPA: tetratricopeptide repeat protein, partial [Vicinamibacterales bacterium]|nr:tetratricopeptide repeat protein [Vicinamibacterales bacterium]